MAGERIYGGSTNMTTLLQNEGISCSSSSSAFEPLFISNSTSSSFFGSRSMVNFEGVHGGKKSDKSFYRRLDEDENCNEDLGEGCYHAGKKRRLTTNQVEFLERNFELENKLEPERKVQLARDLGLHPRQIAIWFQNRRARWKTKQLEKDYEILKASYTSLQTDYDNLLKEKEKLKSEVVILKEVLLLNENSERSKANKPSHPQLQKHILNSNSVEQETNIVQVLACKQEALSSTNSDILDSDNPHYIDADGVQSSRFEPAVSSHVFELNDSANLSQDEDENLSQRFFPPVYQIPKLEEDDDDTHPYRPETSCSYGSVVAEDQPLWFWS